MFKWILGIAGFLILFTVACDSLNNTTRRDTKDGVTQGTKTPQEVSQAPLVSPHGFGAFPDVPPGFPANIRIPWQWQEISYDAPKELAVRVLIKLWEQGDTRFTGVEYTDDNIIYPHYPNTAYVRYGNTTAEDGTPVRYISSIKGGPDLPEITSEMLDLEVVPGVKLIDEEQGGIDALQFLNLERVSKFGFGPYPELPADFPHQDLFDPPYYAEDPNDPYKDNPNYELMDRLWVELWKRGEKFDGVHTSSGLFYPMIRGTIYVEWAPRWQVFGLKIGKRIRGMAGSNDDMKRLKGAKTKSDIPPDIKVLDMSEGIDPYEFLGLPRSK